MPGMCHLIHNIVKYMAMLQIKKDYFKIIKVYSDFDQ